MNSLAKIFLSLLILVLVVVGFLFSVVKVLKIYPEKENLSLEKQISSKPKDINEKQASVEFGINYQEEFTFFDTLNIVKISDLSEINLSFNNQIILKK